MKSSKWCITMWLTEGRTVETLNELVQAMPTNWALEGQIEQGVDSQQKLHAQLFLKTEQTRGTKIIKYFPNCYIDEAKNPFALANYVHKEETRVAEFKTVENRSPQWSQVVDKFFDWLIATPCQPPMYENDDDRKLRAWDTFIGVSIEEGMRVDIIGVNPQYRSCIMRYWSSYYKVARGRVPEPSPSVDRQTDRQDGPPGGGNQFAKKSRTVLSPYE